jgi:hypothetical protein
MEVAERIGNGQLLWMLSQGGLRNPSFQEDSSESGYGLARVEEAQ